MNLLFDLFMFLLLLLPMFWYQSSPMFLSGSLLLYSIALTLKLNYTFIIPWYCYILFLLMVGGLMILILYLTSISNNEMMKMNLKFYFYSLFKILMILFILMNLNFSLVGVIMDDLYIWHKCMCQINFISNFYLEINLIIFMFLYLFLMMLVSVMICSKNNIPLRQMKKYE